MRTMEAVTIPSRVENGYDDDLTTLTSSSGEGGSPIGRGNITEKRTSAMGGVGTYRNSEALNPSLKIRSKLMAEGFTAEEVDSAIEEMWNQHLPYDDFTSVFSFLLDRKEPKKKALDYQEEDSKTSVTDANTSLNATQTLSFCKSSERGAASVSSSTLNSERKRRKSKSRNSALAMGSKLDLVADYENLIDAAFALTEWTTKAARHTELQAFCDSKYSNALPTVVRRAIAECVSQAKFEESVLPAILHLIGSILLNMGVHSVHTSGIRKTLETVMKQARSASIQIDGSDQAFAQRVSLHIVRDVSNAIAELNKCADETETINRLQNEISSLTSSSPVSSSGDEDIIDLVMKRDTLKLAAEKSSQVVEMSISTATKPNIAEDTKVPDKCNCSDDAMESVLRDILGDGGLEKMEDNRKSQKTLQAKLVEAEAVTCPETQELESHLNSYQAERSAISVKMEELRREMKKLEEEDAELCKKIEEDKLQIAKLSDARAEEVKEMRDALEVASKGVEFENTVHRLLTGLESYRQSLQEAVASPTQARSADKTVLSNGEIQQRMGVYLVRERSYFRAEMACTNYLRNRVESLEKKAEELKLEHEQCVALEMTANANHISDALSENRQNIHDDRTVIKGLCGEAKQMCDDLVARLEQFSSSSFFKQKGELPSLHQTILHDIVAILEEFGIEDGRLESFLEKDDETRTTAPDSDCTADQSDSAEDSSGASSSQQKENPLHAEKPRPPQSPGLSKKLTWAKPDKLGKKNEVVSLVEIQKEELSLRKGGA